MPTTAVSAASPLTTLDAIYRRRATRAYTGAPLDRATIVTLVDAAIHAPTAMHEEPWAFVVVQDRAMLARISRRAKELLAASTTATDHAALVGPGSPLADPAFDIFYNAGTLVVICGKPMGRFVEADCWLAAENLMLAATALGYASCPIGFAIPALADPELKRALEIPPEITAHAPIAVGVPRSPVRSDISALPRRRAPVVLHWG